VHHGEARQPLPDELAAIYWVFELDGERGTQRVLVREAMLVGGKLPRLLSTTQPSLQ
jgi:hypothetical protein